MVSNFGSQDDFLLCLHAWLSLVRLFWRTLRKENLSFMCRPWLSSFACPCFHACFPKCSVFSSDHTIYCSIFTSSRLGQSFSSMLLRVFPICHLSFVVWFRQCTISRSKTMCISLFFLNLLHISLRVLFSEWNDHIYLKCIAFVHFVRWMDVSSKCWLRKPRRSF